MSEAHAIAQLLGSAKIIAVVGLSPKPHRDSYRISEAMQQVGYRIIPVHPGATEVLGEKAYPDLASVPEAIDIVNVFRNSEAAYQAVEEALALSPLPKGIWLQTGVYNEAARDLAEEAGVTFIMDRCIRVDYAVHVGGSR